MNTLVAVTAVRVLATPAHVTAARSLRGCFRLLVLVIAMSHSLHADEINFSHDVLPILSDHCFACHGPDAASREGDLRLDLPSAATEHGSDELSIIEPGHPQRSELVLRILAEDIDVVMPPPDSTKQLTPEQKKTLAQWIEEGAKWGKHWAYQRIPDLPQRFSKPRLALDHFIDQRLQREELARSPAATPRVWLRRVTLDTTGLPPTPDEIRAFQSSLDHEAVVERLLHSAAFGERMAWDWLESARYADTHGYQKDNVRTMWAWRDWVIAAFNNNLPYDQFIIHQLAGDLLPDATLQQTLATGFNRNHRINAEAGSIEEEFRIEYVLDRTETMATVMMGMTAACARCHDHKFDPLSQREYYQLTAFFNNVNEKGRDGVDVTAAPELVVPIPDNERVVGEARLRLQTAHRDLMEQATQAETLFEGWVSAQHGIRNSSNYWLVCVPDEVQGQNKNSTFKTLPDHSVLFGGANPLKDVHNFHMDVGDAVTVNSVRLEALPGATFNGGSLARSFNGDFLLSEIRLSVRDEPVPLTRAVSETQTRGRTAGMAIDGDLLTGWSVGTGRRDGVSGEFQLAHPLSLESGDRMTVQLCYQSREEQYIIGRFRISLGVGNPQEVELSSRQLNRLAKEDRDGLFLRFVESHPAFANLRATRDAAAKMLDDRIAAASTRVMVMQEREGPPRETHVLGRGQYDHPGESVSPDVPSFLGLSLPSSSDPNRLTLARWLVHRDHPLTARVAVNRVWQQFFGTGLVKTANDFGYQGEHPSHPELLDWLAADFQKSNWDVKRLVRELVLSETYRQSSRVSPELLECDPENRLLARSSRRRLPAPMLRDQVLFISGLLVSKVGGPPVKPWQPEGLWQAVAGVNSNTIRYQSDQGDRLFRRSLYTFWKRGMPPPNMVIFDSANRETCSVGRSTTNSPLQALTSLNDPCFAVPAVVLAHRIMGQSTQAEESDEMTKERIGSMWMRTQGVPPSDQELSVLEETFRQHQKFYQSHPDRAIQRISPAADWIESSSDPSVVASYVEVAEVLLNLDSTLTNH